MKQAVRDIYDNLPVGEVVEVYGTNKTKDGNSFPVHVRFAKLDDDFAVANVRDITEQRKNEEKLREVDQRLREQAEQLLRESEARFNQVAENLTTALYLTDSKGNEVLYANRAWREIWGTRDQEGRLQLVHPDDRERVEHHLRQRAVGLEGSLALEFRVVLEDGDIRWFELHSFPIRNSRGEIYRWAGMNRDFTQRKEAEEDLQSTNLQLRQTLDELREAQAQIVQQERLRALGEMAAGIAHDFNNQLTAVLGFSEVLLNHPKSLDDKEQVALALQAINTAARDATEVVRRLGEFYRPSQDSETFALIDLRHLVEQVASFTQPKWQQQAQARGVDVRLKTHLREVPLISGNEAELREVLTNLIFNAVDAMQSSEGITVRAYPEGEDVVLSVKDTGTGMTEEVRQRCMEPFFSTKGEGGTGLGLSLAYGIVQRHRGTIEIESEIGDGTTVIIRLPVQVGQQREAIDTAVIAKTGALRVLAVDDQPLPLQVVAGYLAADGHTVETATNGQEALKKFQAGEFDVVITDRAMPVMNGDQLAAMIKATTPDIPVILLTGFGDMIMAKNESVGNVAVIVSKPATLAALREALATAIAKGSAPL